MHLPNAFSPNNYGINDRFLPVMDCEPEDFELQLFDRWGSPIFSSKDPLVPWEGVGVPTCVYAYRMLYAWDDGERVQTRTRQGHVTVVR